MPHGYTIVENRWLALGDWDEAVVRELLSLDMLCARSVVLDPHRPYAADFVRPPTTLHWSRCREYPYALKAAPLHEGMAVLEAGGGHAVFKCALARRAARVDVADTDADALGYCVGAEPFRQFPNLSYFQWDLTRLPESRHGYYDHISCVSVLEHIPDWRAALTSLLGCLKPGGHLVLTCDVTAEEQALGLRLAGMGAGLAAVLGYPAFPAPPGRPVVGNVGGAMTLIQCLVIRRDKP